MNPFKMSSAVSVASCLFGIDLLPVFPGTAAHLFGEHLGKIREIRIAHCHCHLGHGHGGGVEQADSLLDPGLMDEFGDSQTGLLAESIGQRRGIAVKMLRQPAQGQFLLQMQLDVGDHVFGQA